MAARDVSVSMTKRPSDKLAAHVAQTLGGRLHGKQLLTMVHNVALEMMQDRGLRVVDTCASEEQLMRRIDECKPLLRATKGDDAQATTLVFLDAEERTGVRLVRTLCEAHADATLCVINADGATPFTKREFAANSDVEFWQVHELLSNPTRHALVPKHVALTADEVAAMQEQRCILPHQWPTILASDILVRWHHFPKGTVVRIERKGLGSERDDYFRKVVAS